MGGLDPKLIESVKRDCEPGQEPELVKETEWEYVFKTGTKSYHRLSKFFLDENFQVKASEIRERWPTLSEEQRLNFASNFWNKAAWSDNDTEILEVIMQDGNDRLWQNCALAFLKHPDRDRAVTFLIERLRKYELGRL